jgi:hypothetical protein
MDLIFVYLPMDPQDLVKHILWKDHRIIEVFSLEQYVIILLSNQIDELFKLKKHRSDTYEYKFHITLLEIYNE